MENKKRFINVDEAIEKINNLCVDGNENWIGTENQSFVDHADVVDAISNMPTANVEEIVYARWIYERGNWHCSHCDGEILHEVEVYGGGMYKDTNAAFSPRCPHCGAHMDEENGAVE